MKKVYALLLSAMMLSCGLHAQKILFNQDFNGFPGYNIVGWTCPSSGCVPWLAGLPYLVAPYIGPLTDIITDTNKIAAIPDAGSSCAGANSNVFMYTPVITPGTDTGLWLRYDSYFAKDTGRGRTERATVEISTDTGNTWTVIQDVPANRSMLSYETYYINLSAYNYVSHIWIGFRYSDDSVALSGWAVDNVQVFVPSHKDLKLASMTPADTLLSYAAVNTGILHSGVVYNAGLDTVNSFVVKYRQGTGRIWADTITGISIPPFHTYAFTHNIPDTVTSMGTSQVTMWVELAGDAIHNNDTLRTTIRGASFMPTKVLALEDGECTINFFSPKAWVYMNQIANGDFPANFISVHSGDTMTVKEYDDYLYYLHWNNVPYILVDRRKINIDSVFKIINVRKNYFGFAQIDLDGGLEDDSLVVNVHIKPAIDIYGDKRLALVITEDGVTGHDTAFSQRNAYAGGLLGPMGGFESKPDTVPSEEMYYNFVARKVVPSPSGAGMLLHTMTHDNIYNYTFTTTINPAWNNSKLRAIVLLLNNDDSTILNSSRLPWYLEINKPPVLPGMDAMVYPNPANTYSTLSYDLQGTGSVHITLTDLMGRVIYATEASYVQGVNKINLPVVQLPGGLYLVNLATATKRETLKLEVIH